MASGTIQKPQTTWAARYALTLSSSAATIVDDRFTSNARVVITPEYDGSSPLNLCFTAQVLDGGVGNRRLNVYVRTGAGGAVTGAPTFNLVCGYQ